MKKSIKVALIAAIAGIIIAFINRNDGVFPWHSASSYINQTSNGENSQNYGIVNGDINNH